MNINALCILGASKGIITALHLGYQSCANGVHSITEAVIKLSC